MATLYLVIFLSSGVSVGSIDFDNMEECVSKIPKAYELFGDYEVRASCWGSG